jgi:hypothetical protein
MTARPTLPEPVLVAKFWKTRHRNESVHIALTEYEGNCLIDIRIYRTGADGIDRPTTKGLAMAIRKLPELAAAVTMALAKARVLGLVDDDGAGK